MHGAVASDPPFKRLGPEVPRSPVIFSVPHAGRIYPPGFAALARLPSVRLRGLEDRLADLLIPQGATALVATTARAWVDLNRSERDFDPGLIRHGHQLRPVASAKVRGGLGVVPRRLARLGEIWRGQVSAAHFLERIEQHHRPFHRALGDLIDEVLNRFGVAILIDLHSMPPLDGPEAPRFVVGDLFGRSAHSRFAQAALEALGRDGTKVALNTPYAGGHILERHARPHREVHALQIEVDRSLYLDSSLENAGEGLAATRASIAALQQALAGEATSLPIAAE